MNTDQIELVDNFLRDFDRRWPTAKHCVEEIYSMLNELSPIECGHCHSSQITKTFGERIVSCKSCRKKSSFTAGTFFHHLRQARPMLAAIFIQQAGVPISICYFHKVMSISYSSAWEIFKKIHWVIHEEFENECVDSSTLVASEQLISLFRRRSLRTVTGEHPSSEEGEFAQLSENDSDDPAQELLSEFSDAERLVFSKLSNEATHFDVIYESINVPNFPLLANLSMLEMAGLVEREFGRYKRVSKKKIYSRQTSLNNGEIELFLQKLQGKILQLTGGVSRKYLQLFITAYAWFAELSDSGKDGLFRKCALHSPIRKRDIRAFVTPAQIAILV